MKLEFNPDPTLRRVVIIAVLEFIVSFVGGLLILLNEGQFPTAIQWATILCVALLALAVYFLTFLRKEE